jgi:hypothetical protein
MRLPFNTRSLVDWRNPMAKEKCRVNLSHVTFFGKHLTNADLGVGKELGADGQPLGPVFVAGEGSPYALIIVPVAAPGGHVHKDDDAPN